mgnify:FL=1
MANFYKKPLIYLPKRSRNGGSGGEQLARSFVVQGETHHISSPLSYVPQYSGLCFFYKYWNLATTSHYYPQTQTTKVFKNKYNIKGENTFRFDYAEGEHPTSDTDRTLYFGMKLQLDNNMNDVSIQQNLRHDYYKLLNNYYWITNNLNWRLSSAFLSDDMLPCYLLVGVPSTGALYVLKFSDTPGQEEITGINIYDPDVCQGTGGYAQINNPRQTTFYYRLEYFSENTDYRPGQGSRTVTNIVNWVKTIPELANEGDCEIFIIGIPSGGVVTYYPEFDHDELFSVVQMLCNMNEGDFNYTALTVHDVRTP